MTSELTIRRAVCCAELIALLCCIVCLLASHVLIGSTRVTGEERKEAWSKGGIYPGLFLGHLGVHGKDARGKCPRLPQTTKNSITTR